jgi:asparagine synthase (glutamine-hydrolysing)
MCGIAGTIDTIESRAQTRVAMLNELQRHRGPDHSVLARVGAFTIGNTRLAIQDPSPSGNQPFTSSDGRYHCVFNGEIYNYRCLVERYRIPVRTGCDGEVIPHLWAKLGPACLAELRGMFAIAVVDSLAERICLARDPFGIKPLYWRVLADGPMAFASEVKPLARLAAGMHISREAVVRYLRFGAMAADQSPFEEIIAVPPNSVATFDLDGRPAIRPILPDGPLALRDAPASLGPALTESIDLHLASDVPTALLLSAGVDSAAIAAVGQHLGQRLHCLTIASQDAADESSEAAETASHYRHYFQRIPAALERHDVVDFFSTMQRPSIDGLNTYLVSKAVHNAGFKVALSGLGGDEAVGGYRNFRIGRFLPALRVARRMPNPVVGMGVRMMDRFGIAGEAKARRLLSADGPCDGWGLSLLQREVLPKSTVTALTGIDGGDDAGSRITMARDAPASFGAMVASEVAIYLQATLLPDADAFSMASSVELRVPFVDIQVFAASLALAADNRRCPGKAIIGRSLNDPFLERLATRRKSGFSLPMRLWMTGLLEPVVRAAEEPDAPVWEVIDRMAALRGGLIPLIGRERWAEAWVIAVLNAWLETVGSQGTY